MIEQTDPHVLTSVHAIYTPHPQMDPAMYYAPSQQANPTATVHS
jgi:hypothetical protein